ncbi:DUF5791 family protein [Halocatena pleomorpha]|uniref:Uncharacterized protein n=1 Tax=Halocatena pleomorpha TaxID=1785090 RepID=A0A3P3R777_9EURY|nr:DUF5791 family protein [Halocatena pleomorpha]RRJ28858.1 hypothetical protein EIK79_14160 [Halocatena pleomorpha]
MIQDIVQDPGSLSPAALRREYESTLAEIIDSIGAETAAERTGIDRERINAITADADEIPLSEAAAVFALRDDAPDAETIEAEVQDALLMGMTTAVLDVETLESQIDGQIEARAIQQKVEGRIPMTLGEFALLYGTIEARKA